MRRPCKDKQHEKYLLAQQASRFEIYLPPSDSKLSPYLVIAFIFIFYLPTGHVNPKSTCPPKKSTCPWHSGSYLFSLGVISTKLLDNMAVKKKKILKQWGQPLIIKKSNDGYNYNGFNWKMLNSWRTALNETSIA